MKKIKVDFSRYGEIEDKYMPKTHITNSLYEKNLGGNPIYLDEVTDVIYAPICTRDHFEKFYGNVNNYVEECKKCNDIKQQLLDKLSKEPLTLISAAYAYATKYMNYGVDITTAWNTVVEQTSIIEQIKMKAEAEAYDSFKKDYETRLKTDMTNMLEGLGLQIDEVIRDRIDKLKEE